MFAIIKKKVLGGKMYKISVPIKNDSVKKNDREGAVRLLRRFDATRVFLALGTYELDEKKRAQVFENLRENICCFKEQGFEVGVWLWTFWLKSNPFGCMRSIDETEISEFVCPSDTRFVNFASEYIKEIAKCGADIILFDDDFRYGFLSSVPACLCQNHINEINRITNEAHTREQIYEKITSGAKNNVRDAYLTANGNYLRSFAKAMRASVDSVNPKIRLGACACMSSWDLDGTNAGELAYILAGNTRPLVRLIGAPYWAVNKSWGNSLADVCELERMESAWTRDKNIEIIAEGDTWPRPRTSCPASYLECFDTAMRASGDVDGILKYGIDYYASLDYEMGYLLAHERNRTTYKKIDRLFSGKQSVGVRVYEYMNKISNMVVPTQVNKETNIEYLFFSQGARALANNTIPTVYNGDGVSGIAFDENARHLPKSALKNGLIIDVSAAQILTERGIDVGILEIGEAKTSLTERFLDSGNRILTGGAVVHEIKLKSTAKTLSVLEADGGEIPMSYRYENQDGQRFLVLNINSRINSDAALKNYARSRQLAQNIEWLSGKKLPAYSYGHPSLYIQCKEENGNLAVGLWNMFADPVVFPTVELGESYLKIKCVNCKATLENNRVMLDEIVPFGFAFFEVSV